MNKRLVILIFSVSILFLTTGCTKKPVTTKTNSEILHVATTIPPLSMILEEVASKEIVIHQILPTGASPHTFEVTPQILKQLDQTDIVFTIGHGVDNWIYNVIEITDGLKQVTVDKHITFRSSHDHDDDNHDHGNIDPHYWLSPDNAVQIAYQMADALKIQDPNNADIYINNAKLFEEKIGEKNIQWQAELEQIANKDIIVFHDAWGYFSDYFNIQIVSSFEPFPGKSPTPKYLTILQETIEKHHIKALFLEPQLSTDAMQTFATDMNVKLGNLDPLGGIEERKTYIDLIDYNVKTIIDTLK
ncbi:MAG: zinc ABC transporter substrate-binding protein [Candidatus Magasanikbacteria bacterium]|jgi:zinc transport system substrate-binding protein|nr:zinc ABC transporter substrate-binding protein [Candidatus Magasanikbacteria bacterium]MBT4071318.1 zinc ABC transporter substrate-binding protein [Candidatus Magasanikbacteria bacterium]